MSEDKIKPYRHRSDMAAKADQQHLDAARQRLAQAQRDAQQAERDFGPNAYRTYDAKRSVKLQQRAVQDLEKTIADSENVEP